MMPPNVDPSDPTGRAGRKDAEPPDESTGLPWPRTWPGVYLLVMCSFVLWVALLVVLERVFS
jgi:hypothetical protein